MTEPRGAGLLIDFTDDGRPIGIEITSPASFSLEALNSELSRLGLALTSVDEVAPLQIAA